jgi:nucleotide-binding universal stress UspA family protein
MSAKRCIVVGYDGSEPSRAAVRFAVRAAGESGKVMVIHSVESAGDRFATGGPLSTVDGRLEHGRAVLNELVMEEADAFADSDIEVELSHSPPAKAIVEAARFEEADEIVIGTRGAGRVGALLGSVATDVLHRATVPVVVIPANAVTSEVWSRARSSAWATTTPTLR